MLEYEKDVELDRYEGDLENLINSIEHLRYSLGAYYRCIQKLSVMGMVISGSANQYINSNSSDAFTVSKFQKLQDAIGNVVQTFEEEFDISVAEKIEQWMDELMSVQSQIYRVRKQKGKMYEAKKKVDAMMIKMMDDSETDNEMSREALRSAKEAMFKSASLFDGKKRDVGESVDEVLAIRDQKIDAILKDLMMCQTRYFKSGFMIISDDSSYQDCDDSILTPQTRASKVMSLIATSTPFNDVGLECQFSPKKLLPLDEALLSVTDAWKAALEEKEAAFQEKEKEFLMKIIEEEKKQTRVS